MGELGPRGTPTGLLTLTGSPGVGLSNLMPGKLHPPILRSGTVERASLLDRLDEAGASWSVLGVVAPAGYGKSLMLRQWVDRRDARTAWLTLDAEDNDPVVLLTYLVAALRSVMEVDSALVAQLGASYPSVSGLGRGLAAALAQVEEPTLLVLDDLHLVANPDCHDVLALLVHNASPSVVIAVASRTAIPLPVARLRAEGHLFELGPADLAMDVTEAGLLATAAGASLSGEHMQTLVAATEGWPVALYLAARSRRGAGAVDEPPSRVGRVRTVAEYVHEELLSTLDGDTVQFLTRSSVLDRMTGPACDAVLHTFGSTDRLDDFARSNLLVVPLDDERVWYRYHHVFRDLLRAELDRREPEIVAELQRRAAHWHEAHGLLDDAVELAIAAGDVDTAAGIVGDRILDLYRAGRSVTIVRWLEWFDAGGHMATNPDVAVAGAWFAALDGRVAQSQRWAAAAEVARPRVAHPDGDAVDGAVALLRAALCREGMEVARRDVDEAERLLPSGHPWRATMSLVAGLVRLYVGEVAEADRRFARAVEEGDELGARPAVSTALAQRALLALDRGDELQARHHVGRACAELESGRLENQVTSVLVFAAAARLAAMDGQPRRAGELLGRAHALRPRLNHALPHFAVQCRLELARGHLALSDGAGARTLLREIVEIVASRPGLGVLEGQVAELRTQLDGLGPGGIGPATLSQAELRLVPLLQTHLSFREMGERLYISPNTVKTQAISIYRKLGVTSRSEAVDRARQLGLLPA